MIEFISNWLLPFIVVIVSLMFAYAYVIDICDTFLGSIFCGAGITVLLSCVGLMIVLIMLSFVSFILPAEYEFDSQENIYAFQDNQSINGFFIGVSTDVKYYYLIKEDGGVKLQNVNSKNAIIYETKDGKHYIEKHKPKFINKFWHFVSGGSNLKGYKYKIYVPEGSTKYEFNLNMNY